MTLNEGAGVVDFNRTGGVLNEGRWCMALLIQIQDVNHHCGPTAQHQLKFFFGIQLHGDATDWLDVRAIFWGGGRQNCGNSGKIHTENGANFSPPTSLVCQLDLIGVVLSKLWLWPCPVASY